MCMVNATEHASSAREVISRERKTTGTKKAPHKVHMDTIFRAPIENKALASSMQNVCIQFKATSYYP